MEVSGQLHDLASLIPGIKLPVSIVLEGQSGHYGEENILFLPETEPDLSVVQPVS
jgi:hypothetical protein